MLATPASKDTLDVELPLVTLYNEDCGPEVVQLQMKLSALGLYLREPTGHFDAATRQALHWIQRQHGLNETGCFDIPTWYALTFWDCWS